MKKLKLVLLGLCFSLFASSQVGQINQINIVSFTVKNSLPGNIDSWMSIPGALVLVAQKVPSPRVLEPRLVIQIRSNGAVLCGNTPAAARPVDPFDVRTFNTADLTGLLANCHELKEGSYTICAQFFNVDKVAISREVCKEFRVEATNIDYLPPTLITPENGKKFTLQELQRPLLFRWTSLVPKPKEPVTYRVKVWQLMQGQNGVQAMKANQPIITKDVDNLTQATISNIISGPCKPPYLCDFIWNVQAVNRDGKPIGGNNGTSDNNSFSVSTANCVMSPTLIETSCISTTATTKTIRVKIKIANVSTVATPATIYMNHPNTLSHPLYTSLALNATNLVQAKNQSFVASAGVNSVVAAVPVFYPTTITQGNFVIQEVDVNINNSVTSFNLLVLTTSQGNAAGDALVPCYEDILIANIPPCPCTYCKDNMIVFNGANTITDANNVLTLNNNISIPGIQVKQFKAELIGFSYRPQNNNEQCWVCNKDDNQWGNFVGGTFSSPFPSMVNGVFPSLPCCGGNSHHTIGWWGIATTINNKPLQLKISLPPASTLSCCPYNITLCIRYTFTDSECRSCSIVKCFSYIRPPQTGGPPGQVELNEAMETEIKN